MVPSGTKIALMIDGQLHATKSMEAPIVGSEGQIGGHIIGPRWRLP